MYEYDFNFLDVFPFSTISGVKGLSEGQAQQRFPRPKADIPRNWFLFHGGHVH